MLNFTLLNSAMPMCVVGLSVEMESHQFISLAGESGQMPGCLQTYGSFFFTLFTVFPLRLMSCNVNYVRS